MNALKMVIVLLVVAAVAVMFWMQNQSQEKLRAEIAALTEQNNSFSATSQNLSNLVAQASRSSAMSQAEASELLKLRGEVGVLRNQTGQLGKMRAGNQRLLANAAAGQNQTVELTPAEQFYLQTWHTEGALKQVSLAMKMFAGDNGDKRCATNFNQLKSYFSNGGTNFGGNIGIDSFEFMNVGLVNDAMPNVITFRECVARRVDANHQWERVYGLADGSVHTIYGDENDFAKYEQEHSPPPNQ
jgi:hypothetical protein